MPLRTAYYGDSDNVLLRKFLENQTQVINGTLTFKTTGGGGGSLPAQAGHNDEFLTTNGATASWASVAAGGASYQSATNNAGNTTLTAIAASIIEHTAVVTIGGTARTSEIALPVTNRVAGDRAAVKLLFPATANIIVNLRNSTTGGTILKTLTTDTSGDDATIFLVYGVAWELLGYNYPI